MEGGTLWRERFRERKLDGGRDLIENLGGRDLIQLDGGRDLIENLMEGGI